MRSEASYQASLIKKLKMMFHGCVVLKNDSSYMPGILDLSIFFEDKWAMLEVKAYENAPEQPNQRYYCELLNEMSFAAFIFPENEEEVLNALEHAFTSHRPSRLPERK